MRRIFLYTFIGKIISQIGQTQQIFGSPDGPPTRLLDERVRRPGVRPCRRQIGMASAFGGEIDPPLAPSASQINLFKLPTAPRMKRVDYGEILFWTVRTKRSPRLW
jgi:hypothetical protein